MKNAALEAHAKGQSMLKAQHDRKVEAKRLMTEGAADMQGGSRKAFQPSTSPESSGQHATPSDPTTKLSLERAGGNFSEYEAIRAQKPFDVKNSKLSGKYAQPTKKDLNKDGVVDASDVAMDAKDGVMNGASGKTSKGYNAAMDAVADIRSADDDVYDDYKDKQNFRKNIDVAAFGTRIPSFPWAHDEEAPSEASEELGHAEAIHDAEQEDKQHNVDSMIDRIMRGKK